MNEIAQKIGSRKETVKINYQKLKKAGIIKGSTIHINYRLFGFEAVANILVTVKPEQADQLLEYLKGVPEVYAFYTRGIKDKIGMITTLRTLEQLNTIKDTIKRMFSVSEMKTIIWTDVREMNENLAIIDDNRKKANEPKSNRTKINFSKSIIDEIDQKMVDKLAEDGKISMQLLAKKIGISTATARRKFENLKNIGALKVTIQIDPAKIGYQALCIFFIVASEKEGSQIIKKISAIPDVISIMKTTGDYDFEIYAMIQNLEQLLFIQDEIGRIEGINNIETDISRLLFDKWPSPKQYISTF